MSSPTRQCVVNRVKDKKPKPTSFLLLKASYATGNQGASGFEPETSWSAVKCSTTELYPLPLREQEYTGVSWVKEVLNVLCRCGDMFCTLTCCVCLSQHYSVLLRFPNQLFSSRTTQPVLWLPTNVISRHCVTMAMWAEWEHNAMCGLCPTRIGCLPGAFQSDYKVPVCIRTWKMTSNEACSRTRYRRIFSGRLPVKSGTRAALSLPPSDRLIIFRGF